MTASMTEQLPVGYHAEDIARRRLGTRRYVSDDADATDVFGSKQPVLSIGWLIDLFQIINRSYNEGFELCRVRYKGSVPFAQYHLELQRLLRETYDFPGTFGSTRFGVRVELGRDPSTIYMHIPFPGWS